MTDIVMEIVQEKFDRKLKEETKKAVEKQMDTLRKKAEKEAKKEAEKAVEKAVKEAVEKAVEKAVKDEQETMKKKVDAAKLIERISLIQKKYVKNKPFAVIADEMEAATNEILPIYNAISKNPEKTAEEICELISNQQEEH